MIFVSGKTINEISYYSRYGRIDKYEILDHNTRIVNSGTTTIIADGAKITHSGLTYVFKDNNIYTYKSYYWDEDTSNYYIANISLLQSNVGDNDSRLDFWQIYNSGDKTFKSFVYDLLPFMYLDGGSASSVGTDIIDGGTASSVDDSIIDGGSVLLDEY